MNYNFNMSKIYMNKLEAKIKELEEENKALKELNVCVGCEDNPTYKSRIDKAIEYIEHQNRFIEGCDIYLITDWNYVLDILKGSDKQ